MYEILIKWGLETIQSVFSKRTDKGLAVTIEAVRTKNSLVVKRFEYAWEASQALVELSLQVERDLRELQKMWKEDSNDLSGKPFLLVLQEEFHPQYFHRFKRIRNMFEGTNDLLAGYSLTFTKLIQFRQIAQLCSIHNYSKPSDICSVYRALWNHLSSLLIGLLRISSNDLRFWLTDKSYILQAEDFAEAELEATIDYYSGKEKERRYLYLLDDPEKVEQFWANFGEKIKGT